MVSNPASPASGAGMPPAAATELTNGELLRRVARQAALQSTALENSANAVVITDAEGTIFWTNPAFSRISGYAATEVLGRKPSLLKSGRHDRAFYRELWRTVLSGRTWKGTLTNRRKDGTLYHGEQTITPARDERGTITHLIAVMNDVTERQAVKDELRATHAQLQHLLDHSPAVTYGMRFVHGRPVLHAVSNNVRGLLGYGPAEVTTPGWWLEHLHPDDRTAATASPTAAENEAWRVEYRLRHADDSFRWIDDTRRRVPVAPEARVEFVGHWHDITERKRAEATVEAATTEAEPKRRVGVEMGFLAAVIALLTATWFSGDILPEGLDELLRRSQRSDEIVVFALIATVGLAVFALCRWREMFRQVGRERGLQAALRTLHDELDQRVQQRTAELARANEVLRAEIEQRRRAEAEREQDRELMRTMIDQVPDLIYVKDTESRFQLANEAIAKLMGVTRPADLLGRTDAEFHPAEHAAQYRADELRVLAGESIVEKEEIATDGSGRVFLTTKLPRRDAAGKITGVIGLGHEITERRFADQALRLFRAQVDQSSDTFEVIDPESGRFLDVNAEGPIELGCSREEYLDRRVWEVDFTVDAASWPDVVAKIRTNGALSGEGRHRRKDGTEFPIEFNARWVRLDRDYIVTVVRDISARKRSEEVLRETEVRFRQLAENVHEVFWLTSAAFDEVLYVSPAYEQVWGRRCSELLANPYQWLESIHDDDRAAVEANLGKIEGGGYDAEYRVVRPDGSERWVRDRAFPVRDEQGRVHRVAGIAEDVTDRKRAELRLRLQHAVTAVLAEAGSVAQINRALLATIGGGLDWECGEIWSVDRANNVLQCLEVHPTGALSFVALERRTRALQLCCGQGLPGEVWATGNAVWTEATGTDARCLRGGLAAQAGLNGWIGFPIRLRNEVVGVIGFFSRRVPAPDATLLSLLATLGTQFGQFLEREQLTEQFRQAQKLEAIGTLAGGIAHDFNNIIAAISGYSELALMENNEPAFMRECIEAVRQAGGRAAGLVRQILAFSRQQEQQRAPIQLRHVVREATNLLRATIPTTIEFHVAFDHELPPVFADATQIHQVVMNLGTNAWHAMRERPGRLDFRLEPCVVDAALAEQHAGLRAGNYVRLSVGDTGHGMDAATISRIFEPFFTTKAPGEGTGLGLSVVHGIMQSHDGVITVSSQRGQGTTFQLYFPACAADAVESCPEEAPLPHGHGERILFVDDEEALAGMGKTTLEKLDYHVDAFSTPQSALAAVRETPDQYDVIITDLTMPGLTGVELAREALALRRDLPVLLITGHNGNLTASQVEALGIRELLLKPLSLHGLALAVRRVLDEAKKG